MAESEKMAALKKGYAEILFNTAKEAAERVTASEKKAAGYHQELCRTKDEALRLLVRIKQMAEAKMIEAEVKSSRQESKIDELEAQLQEAEGIIIDIREELNLVRDKLENVRNNQVQVLNGQAMEDNILSSQNATPELITPSNSNLECQAATTSDKTNLLQDQRNPNGMCYNTSEQSEQLSISHLENQAALIIRRNKEQEMYINECKQKIHAMVGDSLDKRLPPHGEVIDYSVIKNELILKVGNINEWERLINSPNANKIETKKNLSGDEVRKHVKAFRSRRRKARFGKGKTKRRSCFSQLVKSYQPPSIFSRSKRCSFNENVKFDECSLLPSIKTGNVDSTKSSVKVEEKFLNKSSSSKFLNKSSSFEDELMTAHKDKRQRTVQSRTPISNSFSFPPEQQPKIFQPFSLLSRSKTYSCSLDGIIKSIDNLPKMTGNLVKLSPFQRLDPGLTLIRSGADPVSGSVNVTVSAKAFNRSDTVHIPANKSMESTDELLKQKCDAIPDSTLFCQESNAAMVSAPLMHSKLEDCKVSEGTVASIPLVHYDVRDVKPRKDNNVTLKYTFQRKRKKESSNSSDKSSYLEKCIVERRAEEIQNGSMEGEESNLTNETCRDNGRLAQVARQLISLSGKRWWH